MARRYTRSGWAATSDAAEMLRAAYAASVPWEASVLAACACAREALVYVTVADERPRKALDAAEAWARGAGDKEVVAFAAQQARFAYADATGASACAAVAATFAAGAYFGLDELHHVVSWVEQAVATVGTELSGGGGKFSGRLWEATEREVDRRLAARVRAHIPWARLAAAYDR